MAELATINNQQTPLQNVMTHPIFHIGGLVVGLAAAIALGIWVFMWSQKPDYSMLYNRLGVQDASEMATILDGAKIDYRIDTDSGTLLVESSRLNEAKLKIAAAGMSPSTGTGFELMDKEQGFGTSSLVQNARYHRAQEGELARTITSIAAVQSARVHLALPKESAFLRNQRKPSASVMLQLLPGRSLEKQQIAAITNLVAASVTNMEASQVTVVDSKGRLLSTGEDGRELALTASQFDYAREVEQTYIDRIERILTPIVGMNSVRAQVVADIDFTRTEYTRESYNPDLPAIRSEQNFEEKTLGGVEEGGVPGAVANEPPPEATAPEQGAEQQAQAQVNGETVTTKGKSRIRSTKNYELDKTISHTQGTTGNIRRLSIAVVLDNKVNTEGNRVPYSQEELASLTQLVKETVGFNNLRGDTVTITNTAFMPPVEVEPLPEEPIWKQAWLFTLLKQIAGVAFVLFVAFKLLKVIHGLASRPLVEMRTISADGLEEDHVTIAEGGKRLPKPSSYEENLNAAKQIASQEPRMVAQVVKNWVGNERP